MAATKTTETVQHKLQVWLLFSVSFGLAPFMLKLALPPFYGKTADPKVIFGDGELLLVAVALVAAALSDIVSSRRSDTLRQYVTFAAALALLSYSSIFGVASVGTGLDRLVLSIVSAVGMLVAILVGAIAIVLKEA